MVDTGVYVAAGRLLAQLDAELTATRAGAPCITVVHPGNVMPDYGCGCDEREGIAWTRVVSIAPTATFPVVLTGPVRQGSVVQLAVTIELGVTRCYWTTEDNSMPEPGVLDSMARDALDDAAALHRAAICADVGDRVVGTWMPRGPQGGIHGGTLPVTVLVDTCGCSSSMPPLDQVVSMLDGDPRATTTP